MMEQGGIYTWWHYFRRGQVSGQVATLITLSIAIIFLFVAVTLNISRVSERKTVTSKAADGAAMKLASYVGSYGNKLSWTYFKGGTQKCQRRWGTFFAVLTLVVLIVLQQYELIGGWLAAISIAGAAVGAGLNEFVFEPRIAARMQSSLNKLSLGLNLSEQAVMYALRNAVDDPGKVIDVHDYDEDGDTTDEISRFSQWYAQRVDALVDKEQGKRARIDGFLAEIEDFAKEADAFRQNFSEDDTRALFIEGDDGEEKECIGPECDLIQAQEVITAEKDGEFISLLEDLDEEGLEVSFWQQRADSDDNSDEVDDLSGNLNSFYLWALGEQGGLLNQGFDNIMRMYDMWIGQLYDATEGEAWFNTFQEEADKIDGWRRELYSVSSELAEMIREEPDPARQAYLEDLQERVYSALGRLDDFQERMREFANAILVFYAQNEGYDDKHQATYSWHDSLGWHHVRVEVSPFGLPYIKVKKSKRKICTQLRGASGNVTVKVTRFDETTAASFARRESTPLWKFRYVKDAQAAERIDPASPEQALAYGIKSEATASYSYNRLPSLVGVK